jgi:hypothetical protein
VYFCKSIKDTPHSELRFKTELNQRTSNSGNRIRCHIIESIKTVNTGRKTIEEHKKVVNITSHKKIHKVAQRNIPMHIKAVLMPHFTASNRETDLLCHATDQFIYQSNLAVCINY